MSILLIGVTRVVGAEVVGSRHLHRTRHFCKHDAKGCGELRCAPR